MSFEAVVDLDKGSRLADEKRAKNAGASARFRQRRKEKQEGTDTTILKLNGEVRDLKRRLQDMEMERDFYRNRLRDLNGEEIREFAVRAPVNPRLQETGFSQSSGLYPSPQSEGSRETRTLPTLRHRGHNDWN